jgi:hypothetical protein
MSDELNAPGQQDVSGQQAKGTQEPQPENWQARYTGAVRKIEELTLSSREVQTQLAARASEIEQLKAQLGVKDVEKTVAVGERDKKLSTLLEESAAAQAQLKELTAYKAKVAMAQELGRPELIKIIDRIPAVEDPAVLKGIMEDFIGFADGLVKDREKQIFSGITPPVGPGGGAPQKPTSSASWEKQINALPLGSAERRQAMDDYYDFLANQNK